jgi:hypothetical protein
MDNWGGEGLSPGVNQLGYKADRSPLSSVAEAKNAWTYTSTPPYIMTGKGTTSLLPRKVQCNTKCWSRLHECWVPFQSVIGPEVGQYLMYGWNIRSSKLPIKVLDETWNPTSHRTKCPSNSPSKSPIPPNKTYLSNDAENPDNLWIPLPLYFLVCIYTSIHLKCPGTEFPGPQLIMQVGTTYTWILYHVMLGLLKPNKFQSSTKTDGGQMNTILRLLCFTATALVLCVLVGT